MDNRNTMEIEQGWQWMDEQEEAYITEMYERWKAEQEFGGVPEGESLFW